jgi:hypothetical protein
MCSTFWVCICIPRYPACSAHAHAPYCQMWRTRLRNIFPHYRINGTIFEKKVLKQKICFDFSITSVWNISHYKKNWTRYDQTCILLSSNGSALVNPGLSTTTVLPSSGYLHSQPYAQAPTVTMGYIWIISRIVTSYIQSLSPLVLVRGTILIIYPKKTKGADGWRALTIASLAVSK